MADIQLYIYFKMMFDWIL